MQSRIGVYCDRKCYADIDGKSGSEQAGVNHREDFISSHISEKVQKHRLRVLTHEKNLLAQMSIGRVKIFN